VFLAPDEAYAPENAGARMSMFEATQPTDGYAANRSVGGAFAMADVNPTPQLRLVGGARVERSSLEVGLESQIDHGVAAMPRTAHDDTDVLPSLNAVYAITPSTHLRAAYAHRGAPELPRDRPGGLLRLRGPPRARRQPGSRQADGRRGRADRGHHPPSDPFFDASATFAGAIGTVDWTAGWTR
jgi:hypothetical protein